MAKQFSWRFDPLETRPNSVEITNNGVPILLTNTMNNAQKVTDILNSHQAQHHPSVTAPPT
jgi:hypothetical protein